MKKIALFISGRGSNMAAMVEHCKGGILEGLAKVSLVVSNQKKAEGLALAAAAAIPRVVVESEGLERLVFEQKLVKILDDYELDYIVLAGFMRILSPFFLQKYPNKIINIHPADTRQHQGLNGYQWAWEQRLKTTKITVHYVSALLDKGEIIGQISLDLEGVLSLEELEKKGLKIEHWFYSQMLKKIILQ